ncbi:hypothetical protein IIA79_08595 [bacterium]|nr:hypothetical protein [bacterium]
MPAQKLWLLALVLAIVILAAAAVLLKPRTTLPENLNIAAEDLGTGIRLGMARDEAEAAARQDNEHLEIWVMAREELPGHNPYAERPKNKDLVIALYSQEPADGGYAGGSFAEPVVQELRCYLAEPVDSVVALFGEKLALYKPEEIILRLGEPLERIDSGDGLTHLTYRFASPGKGGMAIELRTSHNHTGKCIAVFLAQVEVHK